MKLRVLVQVLVVGSLWYWICGLQADGSRYAAAMALLVLTAVNAGVLGHLIALVSRDINTAFPGG